MDLELDNDGNPRWLIRFTRPPKLWLRFSEVMQSNPSLLSFDAAKWDEILRSLNTTGLSGKDSSEFRPIKILKEIPCGNDILFHCELELVADVSLLRSNDNLRRIVAKYMSSLELADWEELVLNMDREQA